jgi:rhamnogalacturonan endolyase
MVRTGLVTSRVSLGPRSWLLLATLSCGADGTGATPSGEQPGPSNMGAVDNGASGGSGDDGRQTPPGMGLDGPGEGTPGDIPIVSNPGEVPPGPVGPPPAPIPEGTGFITVEHLDRGVVAVAQGGGVYVGWRMFGYEYDRDEPARISYNLYRDGALLANVTDSTNFQDDAGTAQSTYSVRAVIDGVEGAASAPVGPWAQNFLRVPLQPPEGNYAAYDSSLGDVDGDGQYEIFTLWQPGNAQDNSLGGVTDDVFIDALRMDGTRLWRINLGPNIRAGEHYTQFVVIDADGNGRAEMAVKTAPGTKDGTDAFLSNGPAANDDDSIEYRNADGRVLAGPEYFSVFDGLTGRELQTVPFDVPRGDIGGWGNDSGGNPERYGNRVDRFLATAAYLDGSGLPSFVIARGYYGRSTLTAWNWREGQLSRYWRFDSNETPVDSRGQPFTGQGAHSISVANVDADPQQEIIYGAMTVDHDGTGKCSTGMNHGDALHVSDFMPERPGIEVFMPTETTNRPHWTVRDGSDCTILMQSDQTGADVGRGAAADVVAGNGSAELWASNGVQLRAFATNAEVGGAQPNSVNFLIWWDADELRELENGTSISKVGGGTLLSCAQCDDNGTTKSVPALVADLIGDWREEVIWREANNSALRIYTTTNVTSRRIYTLMHDPQYRVAISWQNVAYNQPPHPGFFIGEGMAPPPTPDIRVLTRP